MGKFNVLGWFLWLVIKIYQWVLAPVKFMVGGYEVNCCRFYPSCSEYALMCIRGNRIWVAMWLIMKRLIKCQPWHEGGIDFPPKSSKLG